MSQQVQCLPCTHIKSHVWKCVPVVSVMWCLRQEELQTGGFLGLSRLQLWLHLRVPQLVKDPVLKIKLQGGGRRHLTLTFDLLHTRASVTNSRLYDGTTRQSTSCRQHHASPQTLEGFRGASLPHYLWFRALPLNIIYLVCIFVCLCVGAGMRVHVCTCMWWPEDNLRWPFLTWCLPCFFFFMAGSFTDLEFTKQPGVIGQ